MPNTYPRLRHPAWWLLLLPLLPLVLLFLVSVGHEVYYSFTSFNMVELPEPVGWQNYASLLENELFWMAARNTVLYLVVGGGVCLGLGWLCGTGAARMPLPLRVILLAVAGLGTLLAFCQVGWLPYVLSGDIYGLLNSLIAMSNYAIPEPVLWAQQFPTAVRLFQLVLLGMGPAFFIFYVGGRARRTRAAWHIGVAALPVWMLLNWLHTMLIIGYPATDYQGVWLPELFYDYQRIRYDMGPAGAVCVTMLLLVGVLVGVAQLLVGLASRLPVSRSVSHKPTALHWCGGGLSLAGCVPVLVVLVLLVNLAVRPMDEFFLFPASFFTQKPTFENFERLDSLWVPYLSPFSIGIYIIVAMTVYFTVILPPAVFFAFFASHRRRWVQAVWLAVMCLAPFSVASYGCWARLDVIDAFVPVLYLECLHSPLLPACTLLTALLLRHSVMGCDSFGSFFRTPGRVVRAALGVVGGCLLYLPVLPFGFYTGELIYSEPHKYPLAVISRLTGGSASAATVLLLAIGLVLLLGGLAAVTLSARKLSHRQPDLSDGV